MSRRRPYRSDDEIRPSRYGLVKRISVWIFVLIFAFSVVGGMIVVGISMSGGR